MSVLVNVQPNTATFAKFVDDGPDGPMIVIHDGTTTLWFSAAGIRGGLTAAADFARMLGRTAQQWENGCRRQLAAAASADPLGVDHLIAEQRQHGRGDHHGRRGGGQS